VVGSEILTQDNPKKKGHDERFTMARIKKGHGFDPPMAFEFTYILAEPPQAAGGVGKIKRPNKPKSIIRVYNNLPERSFFIPKFP